MICPISPQPSGANERRPPGTSKARGCPCSSSVQLLAQLCTTGTACINVVAGASSETEDGTCSLQLILPKAKERGAGDGAAQSGRGSAEPQVAADTGRGAGTQELRKQQLWAQGHATIHQSGRAVHGWPWSHDPPVVETALPALLLKGMQQAGRLR